MKKSVITSIVVLLFAVSINAQNWQFDIDKAKALAVEQNHAIILVFQGSDWCVPCIKLDKEIWSTDEFKAYAANHFVMLKADFPRKKANLLPAEQQEKNNKLAELYNNNGHFPFVVILDKTGKVLGETGYKNMSVQDYIKHLETFLK